MTILHSALKTQSVTPEGLSSPRLLLPDAAVCRGRPPNAHRPAQAGQLPGSTAQPSSLSALTAWRPWASPSSRPAFAWGTEARRWSPGQGLDQRAEL